MRILLSGASGQLGVEIARSLSLVGLNRNQLDITSSASVARAFELHRPELVINAAAYTAVDRAQEEPELAFAVNRDGPARLAEQCARHRVPLIHFSTDYVFEGSLDRPYTELDPCLPGSVYGASKWAGEEAVRGLLDQHFIVRLSWLFGSSGQNFVKTILRLACQREELRVVADQRGCPSWTRHIAAVVVRLSQSQAWGTYHYCDNPAVSWCEFAREIVDQARHQGWPIRAQRVAAITTAEYPTAATRPINSEMNCHKIQAALHFVQPSWREGLQTTVQELSAPK